MPEERRFLSQTFFPPLILGNFGLATHNNIFFGSGIAALPPSSSPSPSPFPIPFRRPRRSSLPATNGSIPLLVLRLGGKVLLTLIAIVVRPPYPPPPPLLLLLRRKGAKVSLHRLANVDGIIGIVAEAASRIFLPTIHPLALSHRVRIAAHKCIHQEMWEE